VLITGVLLGMRSFAPMIGFAMGAWTNSLYVDLTGDFTVPFEVSKMVNEVLPERCVYVRKGKYYVPQWQQWLSGPKIIHYAYALQGASGFLEHHCHFVFCCSLLSCRCRIYRQLLQFSLWSAAFYCFLYADPGIDTRDPRWVGAWWLGFVVCAVCMTVFSLPLFMFPSKLSDSATAADDGKNILSNTKGFQLYLFDPWYQSRYTIVMRKNQPGHA